MVSTEQGWLRLAPDLGSASVLDYLYSKTDFNPAVLQVITHNRRKRAELVFSLDGQQHEMTGWRQVSLARALRGKLE